MGGEEILKYSEVLEFSTRNSTKGKEFLIPEVQYTCTYVQMYTHSHKYAFEHLGGSVG